MGCYHVDVYGTPSIYTRFLFIGLFFLCVFFIPCGPAISDVVGKSCVYTRTIIRGVNDIFMSGFSSLSF